MSYVYLLVAICAEVAATTTLRAADGFSRLAPSLVVIAGYGVSFFFLSLTLRTIPVGIAYAIWSGIGMTLISMLGWLLYKQALDRPAIIGIMLIMAGVLVINLFSKARAG